MDTTAFDFVYDPRAIHFGRGRVDELAEILDRHGIERGLVVCGRNVGANRALMDRIEAGMGDRLAGVFAETTPDKRAATAVAAAERATERGADAFVPVGGGSSLDVATLAAAVHADGRTLADVHREVRETGGIASPDGYSPLVPVPTTLAGADLSAAAGISVELDGDLVSTGIGGIPPRATVYDPAAFETTPRGPLTGSAMNGFDKAIESLYAGTRTPITDATAARAVRYLVAGYESLLTDEGYDSRAMELAVAGIVLAQYGASRPEESTLNLLHALGHGLRDAFGVQQGLAHAVLAPHGVEAVFDAGVDPEPLLAAFGVAESAAVVAEIERVRDALRVPSRLRELDGVSRDGLDEAARVAAADRLTAYLPTEFTLSEETAREILDAAW